MKAATTSLRIRATPRLSRRVRWPASDSGGSARLSPGIQRLHRDLLQPVSGAAERSATVAADEPQAMSRSPASPARTRLRVGLRPRSNTTAPGTAATAPPTPRAEAVPQRADPASAPGSRRQPPIPHPRQPGAEALVSTSNRRSPPCPVWRRPAPRSTLPTPDAKTPHSQCASHGIGESRTWGDRLQRM